MIDLFIVCPAASNYKLSHAVGTGKTTANTIQIQKFQIADLILQIHTILVVYEKLTKPSDQLGFPAMSRSGTYMRSSGVAEGACWW